MKTQVIRRGVKNTALALSLMGALPACLTQTTFQANPHLFEPLGDQRLSDFEQRLTHLTMSGAVGDGMDLGVHWLYAITCTPHPPKKQPKHPLWRAMASGLALEVDRPQSPVLEPLRSTQTAGRQARKLDTGLWVTWPQTKDDKEGWPDELPIWLDVSDRCPYALSDQERSEALWPLTFALPEDQDRSKNIALLYRLGLTEQTLAYLKQTFSEYLPPQLTSEESALPSLWIRWRWWLLFEKASLLTQLNGVASGWPIPEEGVSLGQALLYSEACLLWSELSLMGPEVVQQAPLHQQQKMRAVWSQIDLMRGVCLEGQGEHEAALASWANAVDQGRDQEELITLSLARYHQLQTLIKLGRYEEAAQLKEILPDRRSPLFAPFAFSLGEAMSMAGQNEALMALSTDIFRDRSWRADPHLRGLFYLFVRALTRFEFEGRALELLEDLGPRRELFERVYLFAHVALDEAQLRAAEASTQWLLGHHDDARARPRYHALEARAAILKRDREGFKAALSRISPSQGPLVDAIHRGRRAAFFERQDQALAELLRSEIPRIAGWPTSTGQERKERLSWLDLIAGALQTFIRLRPETRAHQELIGLYRATRQSLSERQLRAYSELIGRDRLKSVLIGYVRVTGADLSEAEPRFYTISLHQPLALTLIPTQSPDPASWRLDWRSPLPASIPSSDK